MGPLSRAIPGVASVLVLAACGRAVDGQPPSASGDAFTQRAAVVAEAWANSDGLTAWRSGFTPLQRLTTEPDWGDDGALKYAFINGWRSVRTDLPRGPERGLIRYAGGATQEVALTDARGALDLAMPSSGLPCEGLQPPVTPVPTLTFPAPTTSSAPDRTLPPLTTPPPGAPDAPDSQVTSTQAPGCSTVVITAARLTTAHVVTSRGTADVPAWEFTVLGARTPLVRIAVAKPDVTEQPMVDVPPLSRNTGIATSQSIDGVSGRLLSFTLAIGACDRDVKGRAYETADLVIVGGTFTLPTGNLPCPAMIKLQPVTVRLAEPLGERLVVDASTGQPVGAPPA